MRRKRILAALLAALLVLPFGLAGVDVEVNAANEKHMRYYYNQLNDAAKGIYDGMYQMYQQGLFKTGTREYDLIANGHLTSEQLSAYGGKKEDIINLLGTARDAFYADYPEIFYVDFSNLSINVSESTVPGESVSENDTITYGVSLGTGREQNYYVTGFSGEAQVEKALKEQEAKVSEIVSGARAHSQSVKEQVTYVHNAIIDNTEYRLDTNCSAGNSGHVRTSYGALIKHESLCEGYARAVKTVLDAMDIPCVLVQGYYHAPDGSDNLHMWNYVQIDGKWYGLDATANDGMKGGKDRNLYLLADSSVMGKNHRPNGDMSGSGFSFRYPQLAEGDSQGSGDSSNTGSAEDKYEKDYKVAFDKDGLLVKYRDGAEFSEDTGVFKISYHGMGYQTAVEKEQVYILARFYQFYPETGEYEKGNWGYADPKPFAIPQLPDALILSNSTSKYIEFAVTKVAPKGPLYGDSSLTTEELEENWNFQGTEKDFLVSTGKLENPKGNYVPSPYAKTLKPGNAGYLTAGKKYHITAKFNEQMEEYDGQKAGYELTVTDGWSGAQNSKIENFKWDSGANQVSFDFTTSQMLSDNYARYTIQITGLRGAKSHKAPDSFYYDAKKHIPVCAYRPQGIYWNLGAKPQLIEPDDLSYKGWTLASGENLVDKVSKVVLVASKPELVVEEPTAQQSAQMLDRVKDKLGDQYKVVKSATYNLKLMTCNQNIVKTGDSVRFQVGFPEGFSPDQGDVTYKAYHFITNAAGEITGVEEISCITTQYGLMVTCNSFSPFAIVAVEHTEGLASAEKKLIVLNSAGGEVSISGAKGDKACVLAKKGDSKTITIKANDGYSISGIMLSEKGSQKVSNNKSMQFAAKYENLANYDNILEVAFVADKPQQDTAKTDTASKPGTKDKAAETPQTSSQQNTAQNDGASSQNSSGGSNSGQQASSGKNQSTASSQGQNKTAGETNAPTQEQTQTAQTPQTPGTSASGTASSNKNSGSELQTDEGADLSGDERDASSEGQDAGEAETEPSVQEGSEDGNGMQEITEEDLAKRDSGLGGMLGTILISVAAAGIIVGGIAGFVKLKKNWV